MYVLPSYSPHSNLYFHSSTQASTRIANMPYSAAPHSWPCNQKK